MRSQDRFPGSLKNWGNLGTRQFFLHRECAGSNFSLLQIDSCASHHTTSLVNFLRTEIIVLRDFFMNSNLIQYNYGVECLFGNQLLLQTSRLVVES
ncbi:hypothetical protein Pan54_38510 [Rubinisphaera italica]|uniref:Uncharacterized protein n=1 Tax=Rubinisphaera italica TaxID=2527969 RepID=A0A5C5XJA3_9PLAN|nr:hypothetical protein Pan54_38510 [Rubinisphaera italica]